VIYKLIVIQTGNHYESLLPTVNSGVNSPTEIVVAANTQPSILDDTDINIPVVLASSLMKALDGILASGSL